MTGIFLGYYLPWDGLQNAIFAQAHGFETWPKTVEGSLVQLREPRQPPDGHPRLLQVHQVRLRPRDRHRVDARAAGPVAPRRTRSTSCSIHDGKFPWTYLGKPIEEILGKIDMTFDEFVEVCDRFTNKRLFVTDRHGELVRDERLELTKINDDNLS